MPVISATLPPTHREKGSVASDHAARSPTRITSRVTRVIGRPATMFDPACMPIATAAARSAGRSGARNGKSACGARSITKEKATSPAKGITPPVGAPETGAAFHRGPAHVGAGAAGTGAQDAVSAASDRAGTARQWGAAAPAAPASPARRPEASLAGPAVPAVPLSSTPAPPSSPRRGAGGDPLPSPPAGGGAAGTPPSQIPFRPLLI